MNPLSAPSVRFLLCLGVFTSGPASLTTSVTAANANSPAPVMMKAADRVPWTNLAELEAFAARGHLQACAQLGEQLLRGDGVAQNIPRALPLLEQAARGGVGSAMFRLGMVYEEGQGVTRDRLRALEYFRAAAAAGEAEGFFNVGAAYVGAHGVKRDYTEGLAWIILAAQRGAGGNTEQTVRDRILKLRRPEWIHAAETRAPALNVGLDAGEIPIGGGLVFYEIRVGHGIEEPGLSGLGDMVKVSALVGKGVAGEKAGFVGNHLHVDGTEHMMERHAGVQIAEPSFKAETGQVIAF